MPQKSLDIDQRSIVIYPHHSTDGIRQRRQVADIITAGQQGGSDVDVVATAILDDLLAYPSHLQPRDTES